jgi:hypothetical protein
MLAGALQEVPLNSTAFPAQSTATQNDAEEHDTDVRLFPPSMLVGAPQTPLFFVTTAPSSSTAAQKAVDGQDTERKVSAGSTEAGAVHPSAAEAGEAVEMTIAAAATRISAAPAI